MDERTRQHDPDQIVPSEIVPSGIDLSADVPTPYAHDTPEADCPEAGCPRRLPPAATGRPGATGTHAVPPPRQGFWGSLTESERAALLACAEEVVYPVGTVLWFEGQVADQAIVIRSGSIRVSVGRGGHERIIAFRGPGDIVGERAALLLRRRSATIVAMDTVHCLRMTTQQFVTYLSDHPRVIAVMEREMYDRLTEQPAQVPRSHPRAAHCGPRSQTTSARPGTTGMPPCGSPAQPYGPWPTAPAYPQQMGHVPYHAAAGRPGPTVPSPSGASRPVQPVAAERVPSHAQPTQPMFTTPPGGARSAGPAQPAGAPGRAQQAATVGLARSAGSTPRSAQPAGPPGRARPAGPPAPPGPAWSGQNCTIIYTDIAGFSAPHRNDADRLDMRRAVYAVLHEAFEESRVPWESCHVEDRGDGALIVIPPEVPTAAVIDPMLTALAVRLRRHNRRSIGAVRIQLRVAVGVGPVMLDPPGVTGFALIHTARLLDAPPLKERLAVTGADLGFIASQFVYESVIAHGAGYVNPAEYEPISCRVKKLKTEGWIHLRGVPARSAV